MRRRVIMLIVTVVVIVGTFIATMMSSSRPVLGLDLQGGISIVLFPVKGSDLSALNTAVNVIRNRVDGLGIAEPDVQRQGNTIVVNLPGVKDRTKAERIVGETAELRFRQVHQGAIPVGAARHDDHNGRRVDHHDGERRDDTTDAKVNRHHDADGRTTGEVGRAAAGRKRSRTHRSRRARPRAPVAHRPSGSGRPRAPTRPGRDMRPATIGDDDRPPEIPAARR